MGGVAQLVRELLMYERRLDLADREDRPTDPADLRGWVTAWRALERAGAIRRLVPPAGLQASDPGSTVPA